MIQKFLSRKCTMHIKWCCPKTWQSWLNRQGSGIGHCYSTLQMHRNRSLTTPSTNGWTRVQPWFKSWGDLNLSLDAEGVEQIRNGRGYPPPSRLEGRPSGKCCKLPAGSGTDPGQNWVLYNLHVKAIWCYLLHW